MHFLAEGRNDRIQRWIAEQTQSSKSEESSEVLDTTSSNVAMTVQKSSTEGKGEDGVYWQMEELEREMALTAYAFGRKNWPVSTGSIDTSILDLADIKRLSQLAIEQDMLEADNSSLAPPRLHDKRRDARIVSQPPELPPTPHTFDLPSPIIHRAVPAPAPIETTSRISDIPPIAFVLQETASPGSSSIHFTPIVPDNLEAFPSTPRSFTSFLKHLSDNNGQNQIKFQELFLSPRLITPRVPTNAQNTLLSGVVPSPATLYSLESDSCQSTPSLSAFPPTPASIFPQNVYRLGLMKHETETMPSVPEAPPGPPIVADQIVESPTVDEKVLPPVPFPTPEFPKFPTTDIETGSAINTEKPAQLERRDAELLSDSASASFTASDIFSGQLSSRFSVFSSKFSNSSLEDLDKSANDSKGKWTPTRGKGYSHSRSRAASVSTSRTGASKKAVHNLTSASHSRAGSRNEMGQLFNARGHHSRNASKAGSRSGSLATADLSPGLNSLDASISEELSLGSESQTDLAPNHPIPRTSVSAADSGAVGESPTHKTTNFKGRTLISRISMGLRRSRSFGSNNNARPGIRRNKTHAATLSGSNVSEHVYFNTNTDSSTVTTTAIKKSIPLPDNVSVATSPTLQGSAALAFSNVSLPLKQPPRLTLTTQFGSTTSTPVIRHPLTPKTPASSISTSFSKLDSTPAEPLPFIKWLECLILRGVNQDNKYDEPVIKWCQQLGEVDDILRVRGSGTIVVYFKEEDVMKKNRGVFEPREVNIAGVGIVTINWSRTMLPPERKPSSS